MSDLVCFWHRRDLRLDDNVGLTLARQRSSRLVGIFCLDPHLLAQDVAPARVKYLLGCLHALQENYRQVGSQLLVFRDLPARAVPAIAAALDARAVVWNLDVEPYARHRDASVKSALEERGIAVQTQWDQLLHAPGEILTQSDDPYKVYTPFWRNWSQKSKAQPVAAPETLNGLDADEMELARNCGAIALPEPEELGFPWVGDLPLAPGEAPARDRLDAFCDRAIAEYDGQRNFPATDGTSQLSAALKLGAIGVRRIWQQTAVADDRSRSDEARDSIRVWRQELAWREFYQHAMYFFPELAEGPYRVEFRDFPWDDDRDRFGAWCEGQTGYPIVDAAMRQLNTTGWMHNRCRMIVASFLTKDLILNWQWGEKYFMQVLYDGDLSANNGGWQWSASSGMDPKPLRIFNPASQAKKFDPDAEYIREWLPELSSLDTDKLLSGEISKSDRTSLGYPEAIVSHADRQREFKQRYKQQKEQFS